MAFARYFLLNVPRLLQSPDNDSRALPEPTTFFKRSSVKSVQNDFSY
jgi:hypothetical protein